MARHDTARLSMVWTAWACLQCQHRACWGISYRSVQTGTQRVHGHRLLLLPLRLLLLLCAVQHRVFVPRSWVLGRAQHRWVHTPSSGDQPAPSLPLCLPGSGLGVRAPSPRCQEGPRSLINSTLMSDMRLCWEGFAGLHLSSSLLRESPSRPPSPPGTRRGGLLEGSLVAGVCLELCLRSLLSTTGFSPFFSSGCGGGQREQLC